MYPSEAEAKDLVAELCKLFYDQGWVSGTGGGISIRCSVKDDSSTRLVMAPSGVQKERMMPADMFVLDMKGAIICTPNERPPPYKPPKLSECSPLFMLVRCRCAAPWLPGTVAHRASPGREQKCNWWRVCSTRYLTVDIQRSAGSIGWSVLVFWGRH